ncbi:hypothetical protein ES703_107506 [subsurface metagenome]
MFTFAVAGSVWMLFGLFTVVDLAVILLLLLSAAIGFWTGFVWQIIRLVSVVVCIWVTVAYSPVVAESLSSEVSYGARMLGSFVGVGLAALLVCYLLTFLVRDFINAIKPEMPDRILGALRHVPLSLPARACRLRASRCGSRSSAGLRRRAGILPRPRR